MKFAIVSLFLLASCGSPFNPKAGPLHFGHPVPVKQINAQEEEKQTREALEAKRKKFQEEKTRVWLEINQEAKETFKNIQPLIANKCFSCHDSNTKLPIYGRIFKKINPVTKHQVEGLKSLDFAGGFPFKAQGNPQLISLLKSIKNEVIEKTMPIKSYTTVYPKKKLTKEDQELILAYIDPIIDHFTEYDLKYNTIDNASVTASANKILEMKCYRCHANSNHRGDFGNMENVMALLKSKYVNLDRPEDSQLFTIIAGGKMPPNKLDKLTLDEMDTVRDWLDLEAKKSAEQKKAKINSTKI